MEPSNKKENWWQRWRRHYRLVVVNEHSFEERFSMRLNRLGVFSFFGIIVLLIVSLTVLLIFVTPIRTLTPGYGDTGLRSVGEFNAMLVDSVERDMARKELYYQNLQRILDGTIGEEDTLIPSQRPHGTYDSVDLENSPVDSAFREEVESETAYDIPFSEAGETSSTGNVYFFTPLRGRVTSSFKSQTRHYGVDVAAEKNESVKATLDGTVVMANWTTNDGYVMHIQHANNYLSVYKHNATLHKKIGDRVKAGENIAIIGNSGSHSSGPHLHFELWHNGIPVDPQSLMVFE